MDISRTKKATAEPIDVPVKFDEERNPIEGFKVLGANSEQYQDESRKWHTQAVRKSAQRGRGINAMAETGAQEIVDQVAKREFAIVLACMVEIYGLTIDGVPAQANEEDLKVLFREFPTWRPKIMIAIEAEQVFTNPSSV